MKKRLILRTYKNYRLDTFQLNNYETVTLLIVFRCLRSV